MVGKLVEKFVVWFVIVGAGFGVIDGIGATIGGTIIGVGIAGPGVNISGSIISPPTTIFVKIRVERAEFPIFIPLSG